EVLLRPAATLFTPPVHVRPAQQLTSQLHVQRRQRHLAVGHNVNLRASAAAHHQGPEHFIPGDPHAELNTANMLVGVLHRKAQKPALWKVGLILFEQEPAAVNNGLLAVQLLDGTLVRRWVGLRARNRKPGLPWETGYPLG